MASLSELRQVFFQECEDQLEELTDGLAEIEDLGPGDAPDPETINRMFRAVHSIKGGAASFSLEAITRYAHAFETVLDELRGGQIAVTRDLVTVFYRAADFLADLVASGADDSPVSTADLQTHIDEVMALSATPIAAEAPVPEEDVSEPDCSAEFVPIALDFGVGADGAPDMAPDDYVITFVPEAGLYSNGHEPVQLFHELETLGTLSVTATLDDDIAWDDAGPANMWQMTLRTDQSETAIHEIFEFAKGFARIDIQRVDAVPPPTGPGADSDVEVPETGSSDEGRGAPPSATDTTSVTETPGPEVSTKEVAPVDPQKTRAQKVSKATVRVDLEVVDELINMVGELVITQSVMTQSLTDAGGAEGREMAATLEDFKTLTRKIQEGIMAIRAQSVKPLFQRMGRIVRETAQIAEKDVRFVVEGEETEVDRTVIERLVDPLTHILRNSIDHGLEPGAARRDAGKDPTGTVTLSAAHRSGRVVIEVRDDGGGVDREKVLSSAIRKGLVPDTANLTDAEIDRLLFTPGFSTASAVTNLSGRGVGMDVVNSEIRRLGGRVSILSTKGRGTTISISLPLTLAVLDGMVVDVAGETMVVPISAIVETIRPRPEQIHSIGPRTRMVAVRESMVPVIDIADIFGFTSQRPAARDCVLLLVEDDRGDQYALTVDRIRDQRQLVIKSLEANYGTIPFVAAATILGDGQIALIVDLDEITHQGAAARSATPSTARVPA
ncbi:two-component system, chemotaxis family, sensor kinase CheA [Palleronia salina]|uniref:Chemotaxis protein CheA n=1 Tax=Palleronia salina TaxID=313368 RepID=A0A1M6HUJ0_9RHOB|nr:chemotaxis protein CheA [Palleronia salina]SHJ25784.1 two-component system, chemotaxis family, sensor kinase CheA [Palleronia salina]